MVDTWIIKFRKKLKKKKWNCVRCVWRGVTAWPRPRKINKLRYRTRVARTARPGPRKRRLAVRVHRCPMREVTWKKNKNLNFSVWIEFSAGCGESMIGRRSAAMGRPNFRTSSGDLEKLFARLFVGRLDEITYQSICYHLGFRLVKISSS